MTLQSFLVVIFLTFAFVHQFSIATRNNDVTDGTMTLQSLPADAEDDSLPLTCPKVCQCEDEQPVGLRVSCKGQNLIGIPESWEKISQLGFTTYLNLNLNQISTLPGKAFASFKMLKELHLSGNYIQEIRPNIFGGGLKQLKEIYLQDNCLKVLPPNAFSKIPTIKKINLAANSIRTISDEAFLSLSDLEELSFDDNSLSIIPSGAINQLKKLKALNLQINELLEIPARAFEGLKLEVLLLSHNEIGYIHNDAFIEQTDMLILNLASNKLTEFPRAISNLKSLHTLKLSGNQISVIPEHAFAENPNLSYLTLSDNPIRIIGRTAFSQLPYLETLYLKDIKDQKVFPNFDGCKSLSSLSLTGGQIKVIPNDICLKLPSLVRLSVAGNQMTNFSGLSNCINLTYLDVSANLIENVSNSDIYNLKKLQTINLGSNKISQIGDAAFTGANLQDINLAYNTFTYLPVKGLRTLMELNITGVQTMLYLPPVELLPNLRKLSAFYPYHCCQLSNANIRSSSIKTEETFNKNGKMFADSYIPLQPVRTMLPYIQCGPDPGPLHPCDNLLPSNGLRGFGWIALIVTLILNLLMLVFFLAKYVIGRGPHSAADSKGYFKEVLVSNEDLGRSQSMNFITCNLSIADLAICGYLGIILMYDASTKGHFAENGAWWQQSTPCHLASFLLVFGTQLAFSSLVIMTIERYLATMHPMDKNKHLHKTTLLLVMAASWVFSAVTATVTLLGGDAYNGKGILPSLSSATCLPWTTEFKYIIILLSIHLLACMFTSALCLKMLCARNKQPWMSYLKNTKWQTAFTFSLNTSIILPLSVIALYISIVTTFPSTGSYFGIVAEMKREIITGNSYVDMQSILIFVLTVIPLRCVLNILLYVAFNKQFQSFLLRFVCIKSKSQNKYPLVGSEYASEMQNMPHTGAGSTSYDERHYDTHTESTGYDTSLSQYMDYRGHLTSRAPSTDCSYPTHTADSKPLIKSNQGVVHYKLTMPLYHSEIIEEIRDDSSVNAQDEFRHLMVNGKPRERQQIHNDKVRKYHGIVGIDRPLQHTHVSVPMRTASQASSNSQYGSERLSSGNSSKHYDLSALNGHGGAKRHKLDERPNESLRKKLPPEGSNYESSNGVYSSVIVPPSHVECMGQDDKTLTPSDVNNFLPKLRHNETDRKRDFDTNNIYPSSTTVGQSSVENSELLPERKQRSSESYDSSKDSGIHSEVDSTSVASDAGDTQRVNLVVTSKRQQLSITNYMPSYNKRDLLQESIFHDEAAEGECDKPIYVDNNSNRIKFISADPPTESQHLETTI